MCGIAGFFNLKRSSDTFSDLVLEMLSMIQHRGPDEMGYYFDEKIAFGTPTNCRCWTDWVAEFRKKQSSFCFDKCHAQNW